MSENIPLWCQISHGNKQVDWRASQAHGGRHIFF